uniref:CSON000128 protein n=1 Tax=Culicoides sonorensis TaxID=179676 RepID=A0A336MJH0_CULSO
MKAAHKIFVLICIIYFTELKIGVNGADPVDEIIFIYVGGPEKNELFDLSSRFSRVNRTHQKMTGTMKLLNDITDDNNLDVNIYRQDGGGWHGIVQREFEGQCTTLMSKKGFGYPVKNLLFKVLPEKCPVKPGTYNFSQVMPRYRREWSKEFAALIPALVPTADKWRIDVISVNSEKQKVALIRFEFRLINKFSSQ